MSQFGTVVVIKRDGNDGSKLPITTSKCTFGRDQDCDVRVNLTNVSREHCKIDIDKNGQVLLTHISTTNHTLLNGKSVKSPVGIRHNDIITISDRKFRWESSRPTIARASARKSIHSPQIGGVDRSVPTPKRPSHSSRSLGVKAEEMTMKSFSVATPHRSIKSKTPVGIVTPTRRISTDLEPSKALGIVKKAGDRVPHSESKARTSLVWPSSAPTSKKSRPARRSSIPNFYGSPILTPTFTIERGRRTECSPAKEDGMTTVAVINTAKVMKNGKANDSTKSPSPARRESSPKKKAVKRPRTNSRKRIRKRKLSTENAVKIIAPSSPDTKKSAALRTIHAHRFVKAKEKTNKKMMISMNLWKRKRTMVERSERVKQALLNFKKFEASATVGSAVSVNPAVPLQSPGKALVVENKSVGGTPVSKSELEIKTPSSVKLTPRLRSSANRRYAAIKTVLNSTDSFFEAFVSPLGTPAEKSISLPMQRMISKLSERQSQAKSLRSGGQVSPDLSRSGLFHTPESYKVVSIVKSASSAGYVSPTKSSKRVSSASKISSTESPNSASPKILRNSFGVNNYGDLKKLSPQTSRKTASPKTSPKNISHEKSPEILSPRKSLRGTTIEQKSAIVSPLKSSKKFSPPKSGQNGLTPRTRSSPKLPASLQMSTTSISPRKSTRNLSPLQASQIPDKSAHKLSPTKSPVKSPPKILRTNSSPKVSPPKLRQKYSPVKTPLKLSPAIMLPKVSTTKASPKISSAKQSRSASSSKSKQAVRARSPRSAAKLARVILSKESFDAILQRNTPKAASPVKLSNTFEKVSSPLRSPKSPVTSSPEKQKPRAGKMSTNLTRSSSRKTRASVEVDLDGVAELFKSPVSSAKEIPEESAALNTRSGVKRNSVAARSSSSQLQTKGKTPSPVAIASKTAAVGQKRKGVISKAKFKGIAITPNLRSLFKLPRISPRADYSNVEGVKHLFASPELVAPTKSKAVLRNMIDLAKQAQVRHDRQLRYGQRLSTDYSGLDALFSSPPTRNRKASSSPAPSMPTRVLRKKTVGVTTPVAVATVKRSQRKAQLNKPAAEIVEVVASFSRSVKASPKEIISPNDSLKLPRERSPRLKSPKKMVTEQPAKQDLYFPEGLKVLWKSPSPLKSPGPTKFQPVTPTVVPFSLDVKYSKRDDSGSPNKRKSSPVQEAARKSKRHAVSVEDLPSPTKSPEKELVNVRQTRSKKVVEIVSPVKETPRKSKRQAKSQVDDEAAVFATPAKESVTRSRRGVTIQKDSPVKATPKKGRKAIKSNAVEVETEISPVEKVAKQQTRQSRLQDDATPSLSPVKETRKRGKRAVKTESETALETSPVKASSKKNQQKSEFPKITEDTEKPLKRTRNRAKVQKDELEAEVSPAKEIQSSTRRMRSQKAEESPVRGANKRGSKRGGADLQANESEAEVTPKKRSSRKTRAKEETKLVQKMSPVKEESPAKRRRGAKDDANSTPTKTTSPKSKNKRTKQSSTRTPGVRSSTRNKK